MTDHVRRPRSSGIVFGLLMILIGVVLLLDNFEMVDGSGILRWWPLFLVGYGIFRFAQPESPSGRTWGAIIALVGLVFLLQKLDVIDMSLWALWPIVLVIVGISMVARSRIAAPVAGAASDNIANTSAFLGGSAYGGPVQDFKGGKATAVMGGCKLDLGQATMKEERAVLDVFALAGGIEVIVPRDWSVDLKVTPFLGGAEDKTVHPPTVGKTLVVTGVVAMGGVEIKN